MKTLPSFFFTTLVLVLTVFVSNAQAQSVSCSPVTEGSYASCCPTATPYENRSACADYLNTRKTSPSVQGAPSTTPVYGTVNSGTLNTKSPFTEQPLIAGNQNVSPQSSSPVLAACSAIKFKSLLDILVWVKCVITAIVIPLIFTFAFLFFLWNVLRFLRSSADKDKQEAKERMWWGIIALFIMLSVWGIIAILSGTLGITPSVPLLQTSVYLDPANANKGK